MTYKDPEGRKTYYKKNRDALNKQKRDRYAHQKAEGELTERKAYSTAYGKTHRKEYNANVARYRVNHPERVMWRRAKERARKKKLDFNIEESDIIIPEVCPVYGMPLVIADGKGKKNWAPPNSPSLDRIDSSKGYVKGNVWVISWRANHIKNDATLEELEKLVAALRSHSQASEK